MKVVATLILACFVLLVGTSRILAQVLFDITPDLHTGQQGTSITFSGTLRNTSRDEIFLNGVNHNLNATGLSLDDSHFFANAPLSLLSGQSWTGDLFDINIGLATPTTHSGNFSVLGGNDSSGLELLASANFIINIVPEPNVFYNPANGHYYQRVDTQNLTWYEANMLASNMDYLGLPGHLVTITSADEQAFIDSYLLSDRYMWLGGLKVGNSSDPSVGWQWITGETWAYTNWQIGNGEPNNDGGHEDRLEMIHDSPGQWNDLAGYATRPSGFIVEYEQFLPMSVPEPGNIALLIGMSFMGVGLLIHKRHAAHSVSGAA